MSIADALRLQRGLVMHALRGQYPHPLTQVSLERQVAHLVEPGRELDGIVHYLADKGYVEVKSAKVGQVQVVTYRLTAAGVDVADGSVSDPGVDLGNG